MPGSHLFNLGLFQKKFGGNNKIAGVSINLGSTKGRGSSTRMLNFCKTHSTNPSGCINQFVNIAPAIPNISISYTGASRFNSNPYTGTSNGYTYLKFTNSGTINMISESGTIYYVIVGGGGNGNTRPNSSGGGGGGGGQVLSGSINLTSGTYNIVVGSSGQTSSFYTLIAANGVSATNSGNGGNSGSGGLGGIAVSGNNQEVPGNPGVNGGGGGGGYNVSPAGIGGSGPVINFADGSSGIYFGGGGGGGTSGGGSFGNAIGGAGGGGIGGGPPAAATSGSANTGGGGGGGAWNGASTVGGTGASGVVLIYYI
jgi:hypothetical protein